MIKQLKFRKTLKTVKSGAGFTLIELLVVIAVLGVLAAGVMTAINPIKRMNQAKDAKIKNDIGQIAQAEQAFFTTNQHYSWTIQELVTSGDLKSEPKTPDNQAYRNEDISSRNPSCGTALVCEITLSAPLNDPKVPGDVWCWRSNTGESLETAPVGSPGGC